MTETNKRFSTEDNLWVTWSDLSSRSQLMAGVLNGLVGFYAVLTFSWNHQVWSTALLPPLFACLVSGTLVAVWIPRLKWTAALILAVVAGLFAEAILLALFPFNLAIDLTTLFGVLGSAALTLPYIHRIDVSEGCILNLKLYTAVSLIAVVVFVINDIQVSSARTPLNIMFTLCMSLGILVGELAFARHIQARATKLSQDGLLFSGAGVLTLAVLVGSLGPIAAFIFLFVIAAGVAFILSPVLGPLLEWVWHRLQIRIHRLHQHGITPRQPPKSTDNSTSTFTVTPHPVEHWIIWALILALLFACVMVMLLRRKKPDEALQREKGVKPLATVIRRDSVIDKFVLEKTDEEIRKRYQARLRALHHKGVTIGRSESPQELLRRLPGDIRQPNDRDLTLQYEEVRYGPKAQEP